jgi:hypothetical protein
MESLSSLISALIREEFEGSLNLKVAGWFR